jgi:hypothetical protein
MFVPPFDNWLSITIPLVPCRAFGAVTQVDVPEQIGVDIGTVPSRVEASRYPLVGVVAGPPTPKNIMSVVPL